MQDDDIEFVRMARRVAQIHWSHRPNDKRDRQTYGHWQKGKVKLAYMFEYYHNEPGWIVCALEEKKNTTLYI